MQWDFGNNPCESFEALKFAFTSAPVLTHWVPDRPIIVETDASDYALGAILSIQTDFREIHPVAFHSHMFSAPELNYDTHDKELLALLERDYSATCRIHVKCIVRTLNSAPGKICAKF